MSDIVNPILVKAFDFPAILERLKSRGLNVSEDALKAMTHEFFLVVQDELKKASPLLQALLSPLLIPAEAAAIKEIDKLDGEIG